MSIRLSRFSARCRSGFSLVEAMLALALLTGGCLAIVGMFVVGDRAQARAAHVDDALALVRAVMEWKRTLPYERLDEDVVDGDGRADGRSLGGADQIGSFHREWRVWRDRPGSGLSTVSVSIRWFDEQGRMHQLNEAMVRADGRSGATTW